MDRLQQELHRLYLIQASPAASGSVPDPGAGLVDAQGRVRALVLEIHQPAGWQAVASLWQGLQDELALPAPALAVSGVNAYQLWLSLAEPVPVPLAHDFLGLLRQRFLRELAPGCVRLHPSPDTPVGEGLGHARMVPALQPETGRWSAFLVPSLGSMFAQEPWLDLPPNPEAQAELLQPLLSIQAGEFQAALRQLQPPAEPGQFVERAANRTDVPAQAVGSQQALTPTHDPKLFLLQVMNDASIDLRLRIEAAKALLPYVSAQQRD